MAGVSYGPRRGAIPSRAKALLILACLVCGMVAGMAVIKMPAIADRLLQITHISDPPITATKTTKVTVQSGETLYSIAQRWDKKDRPDAVADEIEKLNGLPDARIIPGETLTVPVGGN